jgi:feruloyl esterase
MDAESLRRSFRPDELTTVVAVRSFKEGDPLVISEPVNDRTPRAKADLLLVKLNVGPGNPGPADAPSTSPGIGIEVWLPSPANWDGRVHALGGNGWSGGDAGSPVRVANSMFAADIAAAEGSVVSTCDSGHSGQRLDLGGVAASNGDFAMDPDGCLSKAQWRDFSSRSLEQQALKTKALAAFYYGRPAKHAYFEGLSLGGRQGYKLAQRLPDLYDGIVANMPALHWTRFFTAALYNDLLCLRDLNGVRLTEEQMDLVSNAAIRASDVVGGEHLGYIMDPARCRYDPTEDPDVICVSDGGRSTSPHAVTRAQAAVINKMWYGMTSDGSAPAPAQDNGWDRPLAGVRRWYGRPRGTSLYSAAMRRLFGITPGATGPDMVALELQNPTMAQTGFRNATGDGADLWKTLSYEQLSNAFDRGLALQPLLDDIDTDDPDLSAYKARGGKILTWHGLNDEAIPVQGTIHYYEAVAAKMGGHAAVQSFLKLYLVPGVGHFAGNGTSDPETSPPVVAWGQFYRLLVDWVENGVEPDRIEIATPPAAAVRITQPICPYPQKVTYVSGDPREASSYIAS